MADIVNNESVWKRITRLFRSGPVVRHKIAGGEKLIEPRGTAKEYKKELSNLYVHSLASYGQYERLSRYSDYSEMEFTPEIASAIDIYADEATAYDENGAVIKITSNNNEIKQILETLFFDVLNIEFNIWSWTRNLCKYGDFILFVDASEGNGILNLLPIPINEIEREEGYDKSDPFAVRFRWLTQGNMILENWQCVHFRLLGNDSFLPYGSSIVEAARRIWRQLILIEDAMLVYRIVRSPERRVFKIDVGNVPPGEVEAFMEQIKTRLRRNQVIDQNSGRVDLRYNPLSVDEDYFIPVRGDRSSDITTLAGGQFTGDIDDVQYIQNKLFAALKVPKAYLGYEGDLGSKATLAQQDVRFARTIERVQKILIAELNKIAIIHLFLLGYSGEELVDFEISMANPSTIAEQQKLELWRTRFEIAGSATEGMLDRETVYKKIFGLGDEDIQRIRDGKRLDRLEDMSLENVQAPPESAGGEDSAQPGDEPVPGEDELPSSLGGEPGTAPDAAAPDAAAPAAAAPAPAAAPAAAAPITSGAVYNGQPILEDDGDVNQTDEKRNKGSEGNNASISVSKGKNLFSTGEKQHTLVFGVDDQAQTDPGDMKYFTRLIRRPFSDSVNRGNISKKTVICEDSIESRLNESIKQIGNIDKDINAALREARKISVKR